MAGVRLVNLPPCSFSVSRKIDAGEPLEQLGRREGVLIGGRFQLPNRASATA